MTDAKLRANVLLQEAAEASAGLIGASLRDLGFSGYAADAYCALVRVPEATAGALIARTGIPDSKIYYALDELAERGLVEVQAGKPKAYRAVPSAEAAVRLQRLLEEKHERQRAAVTRLVSLLEPLRAAARTPTTDLAYIVKGLTNVVARAESLIASARREIVLLASDEAMYRKLEPAVLRAARRRIKVKLAVPDIALPKELERAAEIRAIVCSCVILVVDREQVLTVTRTSEDSAYGITSADETLIALGMEYWESPRCCVAAD